PKGVMIEHRNLNNLIVSLNSTIYQRYTDSLRVGLVSPYYFDASVQQIFPSILYGHSLYIVDEEARRGAERLVQYYKKNSIDISDATPMHMKMLLNSKLIMNNELLIKHFILGGEVLPLSTIKEFYKYSTEENIGPQITNVYGPTECCVDTTMYEIQRCNLEKIEIIPIGKPLNNTRVYILDNSNELQPIGIVGELCISGGGLARGY
ncbi:non-ribosomal peptide synthetase, partial [Bacillus cereus]